MSVQIELKSSVLSDSGLEFHFHGLQSALEMIITFNVLRWLTFEMIFSEREHLF